LYALGKRYRILDALTVVKKDVLDALQYLIYFFLVIFVLEEAHGTKAWIRTFLGAILLSIPLLRLIPYLSIYPLRRLVSKLDSDTKLQLTAAHAKHASREIEEILQNALKLKAAPVLASHLCELPNETLYKLLHI
jgi:uncharacterized membrane protein